MMRSKKKPKIDPKKKKSLDNLREQAIDNDEAIQGGGLRILWDEDPEPRHRKKT